MRTLVREKEGNGAFRFDWGTFWFEVPEALRRSQVVDVPRVGAFFSFNIR